MKWNYIADAVFFFYLKLFFVIVTHVFAKAYTARARTKLNPPTSEKFWLYAKCIIAVLIIAWFPTTDPGDEYQIKSPDHNKSTIAFCLLIVPALYGATSGFRTTDRTLLNKTADKDDYDTIA